MYINSNLSKTTLLQTAVQLRCTAINSTYMCLCIHTAIQSNSKVDEFF